MTGLNKNKQAAKFFFPPYQNNRTTPHLESGPEQVAAAVGSFQSEQEVTKRSHPVGSHSKYYMICMWLIMEEQLCKMLHRWSEIVSNVYFQSDKLHSNLLKRDIEWLNRYICSCYVM